MAKDRDERFQSAAEVADVLERELAHLQNPSISAPPVRAWMPRRARASTSSARRDRRRAMYAATVCGVLLATLAIWRPWETGDAGEQPSQGAEDADAASTAEAGSIIATLPPPTVPLWDADGVAEVSEFGMHLEAGLFDVVPSPPSDPWAGEVAAIRDRLAELSDEFSISSESKE
jgi:hypothetical protein